MNRLAEQLLIGASLGAIYALIAMGFVIIYRATRVINFAQGSLLLLGVYITAVIHEDVGFIPAALVGIGGAATMGAAMQVFLLARIDSRDHLVASILTIGVDVIIATELARRIGSRILNTGDPWGDAVASLVGFTIPEARIAAAATAASIIAVLFLTFKYTSWGIAMRAAAEDGETASLMGIRLTRTALAAWVIGGALAAVAGLFLAGFPAAGVDAHSGIVALSAVPAVIIGGLDSPAGAVIGGLVVGVVATLASGYEADLGLGQGLGEVVPYLVAVLVLLWRPAGLFGTKDIHRV